MDSLCKDIVILQAQQSTIRIEPGHQLLDTALVQQDDLVLALLLQDEGQQGGSIRLFPLSATPEHELPQPHDRQQEVLRLLPIGILFIAFK